MEEASESRRPGGLRLRHQDDEENEVEIEVELMESGPVADPDGSGRCHQ
jgi:hypothetical protein